MDYFDPNASHYPTSASGEFDAYLDQILAPGHAAFDLGAPETSPYNWYLSGQQGYMSGSQNGLRPEGTFESTSLEASHEAWTQDYGQMSLPQHCWSTTGGYTQPYYTGITGWDESPAGAVTLPPASSAPSWREPLLLQRDQQEFSVYRPQTDPPDYWGGPQSGSFISTFRTDVQTPYQPSVDSSGAGAVQTHRYSPYETPHSRSNRYTNMEAGPSYSAPQATPYVTCPPINPSGGLSEATADAENPNNCTEEEEIPYRRRAAATDPRGWRGRYAKEFDRLRVWAIKRKGNDQLLSREAVLRTALEVVQMLRPFPVYPSHQLREGAAATRGRKTRNGAADAEAERRGVIRGINEEISRYYKLPPGQTKWCCPELISEVLRDFERLEKIGAVRTSFCFGRRRPGRPGSHPFLSFDVS